MAVDDACHVRKRGEKMSIEAVLLIVAIIEIATLYRIEWVSNKRWFVMDCYGIDEHNRLPPFVVMVVKFWVWNVDAFLRNGGD